MLHSKDFNFSFSGLKTAVLTVVKNHDEKVIANICEQDKANIARGFVDAIVDVLTAKCVSALEAHGPEAAGDRRRRRRQFAAARLAQCGRGGKKKFRVFYPELEFCTDNGAMIAFAGAMRLQINPQAAQKGLWRSMCGRAGRWTRSRSCKVDIGSAASAFGCGNIVAFSLSNQTLTKCNNYPTVFSSSSKNWQYRQRLDVSGGGACGLSVGIFTGDAARMGASGFTPLSTYCAS